MRSGFFLHKSGRTPAPRFPHSTISERVRPTRKPPDRHNPRNAKKRLPRAHPLLNDTTAGATHWRSADGRRVVDRIPSHNNGIPIDILREAIRKLELRGLESSQVFEVDMGRDVAIDARVELRPGMPVVWKRKPGRIKPIRCVDIDAEPKLTSLLTLIIEWSSLRQAYVLLSAWAGPRSTTNYSGKRYALIASYVEGKTVGRRDRNGTRKSRRRDRLKVA